MGNSTIGSFYPNVIHDFHCPHFKIYFRELSWVLCWHLNTFPKANLNFTFLAISVLHGLNSIGVFTASSGSNNILKLNTSLHIYYFMYFFEKLFITAGCFFWFLPPLDPYHPKFSLYLSVFHLDISLQCMNRNIIHMLVNQVYTSRPIL